MPECFEEGCAPTCPSVFSRVLVYHYVDGGTRVEWSLDSRFRDAAPYTFTLQVGHTAIAEGDWEDVGDPVVNTYTVTDTEKRLYGKTLFTHYRVKLETSDGIYYSNPEPVYGVLSPADWRRAREILRKEQLRLRKLTGIECYLLKRRNYGELCDCLDEQTGEILNGQHERCFGTGFVDGYYPASECIYVEMQNNSERTHVDSSARGTVNDVVVPARTIAVPSLDSYDVIVEKNCDRRWVVHSISSIAEFRGIPLVLNVELRLIPFSDVIYKLQV